MRVSTAAALLGLMLASTACVTNSAYMEDQAQADALKQCSFYDNQTQRTRCMKEMMAVAEDKRRAEIEKLADEQLEREDEMALREAMGLPTD